ncbi:hypothetical protein BH10BAC2_BH10BAC2_18570 [soil metagenome]
MKGCLSQLFRYQRKYFMASSLRRNPFICIKYGIIDLFVMKRISSTQTVSKSLFLLATIYDREVKVL